ncbi:MAG: hypothetical protein ABIJ43_00540 [Candidatus Beckwithbacteria bacterium]
MSDKLEQIQLEEFIKNVLTQIEKGAEIGKRSFKDAIEFEVSVSKTEKLEGNVKIYIAQGGGEINKESVAKIKFKIFPNYPDTDSSQIEQSKNWGIGN